MAHLGEHFRLAAELVGRGVGEFRIFGRELQDVHSAAQPDHRLLERRVDLSEPADLQEFDDREVADEPAD